MYDNASTHQQTNDVYFVSDSNVKVVFGVGSVKEQLYNFLVSS